MKENSLNYELFPCCECGAKVDDPQVKAVHSYSLIGWFFWSMGTTVIPKKIRFHCKTCHKDFFQATDRQLIQHFITLRKN